MPKAQEIQISKEKIRDIIQKSLGKGGTKGGKPIVSESLLRFDKDGVKYGEMIGLSAGNIGWFDKSYFGGNYKIKTPVDVVFKEEHLTKVAFIRTPNVIMKMGKDTITFLSPDGGEEFPVSHKDKIYDEEDLTLEDVHAEVMPNDIKKGERIVQFIDLESTTDRSNLTEKEIRALVKKAKKDEDFEFSEEEDGYYEVYAYLRLPKKEMSDLPNSDSIIFRKITRIGKTKKATPSIELQTLVKLDQKSGYKRVLGEIEFLKWHDDTVFEVRVDRSHFDKALAHLTDPMSIVFTQDYIMMSNIGENHWIAYLIGYAELESDITPDDETADVDSAIDEVKSQTEEDEDDEEE